MALRSIEGCVRGSSLHALQWGWMGPLVGTGPGGGSWSSWPGCYTLCGGLWKNKNQHLVHNVSGSVGARLSQRRRGHLTPHSMILAASGRPMQLTVLVRREANVLNVQDSVTV